MITMTTPLWVSILAPYYLGEKLNKLIFLMIFSSMAGLILVMKPQFIFGD